MEEIRTKKLTAKKTRLSRNNKAVQGTNDSSLKSKWSAAVREYFTDNYLAEIGKLGFSQNGRDSCVRTAVINRGYWIRVYAINHVITSFLDFYNNAGISTQVISLGAGYDSTYFRLVSSGHAHSACYIEVDFPELLAKKLEMIRSSELLSSFLSSTDKITSSPIIFDSPNYKLIGVDLCDLQQFYEALKSVGVDFTKPTLLLSEVVLVYLNSDSSSKLIQWAADCFQNALFLTYEQVYPDDAFGTFMCRHFKNIGTALKSISEFPTIPSQVNRYSSLGWTETVASDMNFFYNNVVPHSERLRIDAIEMFDEYEEWHLKCAHYVIITALKGSCALLRDKIWLDPVTSHPLCAKSVASSSILEIESNGLLAYSCLTSCSKSMENEISECSAAEIDVTWNGSWSNLLCRVYGHTCNRLTVSDCDVVLVTGGFGTSHNGKFHQRLRHCSLVNVNEQPETVEISLFERMYHSSTSISLSDVVIFGGRTSPANPTADVFLLGLTASSNKLNEVAKNLKRMETSGDGPCPRWRHSATFLMFRDFPAIVVFGGLSVDQRYLDDCWLLNCSTWRWEKINGFGDLPCGRSTHTSGVWKSEVLIICGLGSNHIPLNSIHMLNITTSTWRRLQLTGETLHSRYSHSSTIHMDRLILVGGISFCHSFPPVSTIDLMNGTITNYSLKISPAVFPLMLHNYSSIRWKDNKDKITLMLIGGGGNCFSFGTHLNEHAVTLTL